MPINLTRAWSADSLVPAAKAIAQPVNASQYTATPNTATQGNSTLNSIMSQIFGPNYQNTLNSVNTGAGGAPASLQDVAALISAQAGASETYARRNLLENAVMQQGAAQWNAEAGTRIPMGGGGALNSVFNPDWVANQNMQAIYNRAAMQSNQTAAAVGGYAPGMQSAVGQQNTGARSNPYQQSSGWISPAQVGGSNSFQAGVFKTPSFNIMSAGI